MRKYFCKYNPLTERYELALSAGSPLFSGVRVQAETDLLPAIAKALQALSDLFQRIHQFFELLEPMINADTLRSLLQENETNHLSISNMHYGLFQTPLPTPDTGKPASGDTFVQVKHDLLEAADLALQLEQQLNIADYSRACSLLHDSLLNQLHQVQLLQEQLQN